MEIRWKLEQEFIKVKCKTVKPTDEFDHFDNYLQYLAEEKGIEIYGLETSSQQLGFIEKEHHSSSWEKEKNTIRYLIEQLGSKDCDQKKCLSIEKYIKFELDYKFDSACEMEVLLKERNKNWMKILPKMLSEKNCFITVGLFHLYNKCGVLEQLKDKGFKVEPIDIRLVANNG